MNDPLTEHEQQQAEAADIIAWLEPDSLSVIQTQAEGRQVEAVSRAAIAYYREQRDYESVVKAWRLYVEARRRTTELCMQEWQGHMDVTLSEMGFTKMQWHRRVKEYKLPVEQVDAYFDECIAKGWQPSIAGMLKVSGSGGNGGGDEMQSRISSMLSAARWIFTPERMTKLNKQQRHAIGVLLDAFAEAEQA